ncbi:MAG: hypothetical protein JO150_13860 [Acidobacteriaceae bacterium]|nr:hypothetical protein [Acidobacteriaceae bacterium]
MAAYPALADKRLSLPNQPFLHIVSAAPRPARLRQVFAGAPRRFFTGGFEVQDGQDVPGRRGYFPDTCFSLT